MPQRERVAWACMVQHRSQRRHIVLEVDLSERFTKSCRRVFEVRSAGADAGLRFAGCSCRNYRLAIFQLQRHPARSHAQETATLFVNFKRVGTTEIRRDRGRSIDEEEPGRRPDSRTHLPARELEAMLG